MPTKINKTKNTADRLADLAQQAGIVLMTAAMTLSMAELPDHSKKVVVPQQPVPEFANNSAESNHNPNAMRREREETGPHYVSYSVAQRTPGRAGRV